MIGLIAMNAVLSLAVYPYIGNHFGAAFQGRILFFTALMNLLAGGFGSAANYGRMKVYSNEGETENGEYNIFLLTVLPFVILTSIIAVLVKGDSAGATLFGIIVLMFSMIVRMYADVEYRLNMNYKRFALYYLLIAAGYLIGLFLYPFTKSWVLIFLSGELFGILYVVFTGKIFKGRIFGTTKAFKKHFGILAVLSLSYLLSDFVASSDRLLLPILLDNGDELTSIFYYASLVGKIMSLLSTPLNGVLSGHIAKEDGAMTRQQFLKLILVTLGIFIAVTFVSFVGSHIFVYLFYRPYYEAAKPLFLLANAGQILFFICNTLMVIVLRNTDEKYQIAVGAVYILAYFLITIPLIRAYGVWGMGWGLLIANAMKFVLFAVFGFFGIRKKAVT